MKKAIKFDLFIYDRLDRCLRIVTSAIGHAIRLGRAVCDTEPGCWFVVERRGEVTVIGSRARTDIVVPRTWRRVPRRTAV